jgi:cobalt/nickel transport system permease protein
MHMADALLSPAVGGTLWAASAGAIAYSAKKVRNELDDKKVPLMGVLGAFLFAVQMINFTIPATGSSGHLGGGLLLTILLGPFAALLTIASVLVVQALFFADGGLLALGCNIFNMGVFPAFIVYPLVYSRLIVSDPSRMRLMAAIMISAIAGLQLGALGVVVETLYSGISALPFSTFVLLMQPIHLAVGIVEGLVTAAIISVVYNARPEILNVPEARSLVAVPLRNTVVAFLAVALVSGSFISWFASKNPDSLEWAIKKVTGQEELEATKDRVHGVLAALQEHTAILPDYSFKKTRFGEAHAAVALKQGEQKKQEAKNGGKLGTSLSGLLGGMITLGFACLSGFLLKKKPQPTP